MWAVLKIDFLPLPPVNKKKISTEEKKIQAVQTELAPQAHTNSCVELYS